MLKDKAYRKHKRPKHTRTPTHTHTRTHTQLPNDVCECVKEVGNYAAYKSNKPTELTHCGQKLSRIWQLDI